MKVYKRREALISRSLSFAYYYQFGIMKDRLNIDIKAGWI